MGKKIIMLGMAFIMCFMCLGILGGCKSKTYESEYFFYKYDTITTSKEKVVDLKKLTEKGKEQKILVVSTKIKGRRVCTIQVSHNVYGGRYDYSWHSDKLEKVFFPTSKIGVSENLFDYCPNMGKIIIVNFDVTLVGGGGWDSICGIRLEKNILLFRKYIL